MTKSTGIGIWLFLAISGVGIGCFSAFDIFYFQGIGYSVTVIGALTATFNISVALSEIPSAIVFDRKSHWLAIQIGNGLRFLGLILFFLALGPVGDFSAEALTGIGAAAMSGTSVAYILNHVGDMSGHQRRRTLGMVSVIGAASSLIGGGIGLVGFMTSPRLVWGLGALFMGIAGLVFFFGHPSNEDTSHRTVEPFKSYMGGLLVIARHPRAWLSITADAALIAPFILWQLRLGSTSLWAVLAGFSVMKLAGVVGGRMIGHRRVGRMTLYVLIICNVVAVSGFAIASSVALVVACFGLHVLLHIAISVYCQSEFQSVVASSHRAGASSTVSLLSSFVTAVAAIAVGRLSDIGGAPLAIIPTIVLYLAVGTIALVASKSIKQTRVQ